MGRKPPRVTRGGDASDIRPVLWERPMADLAFILTTVAVFALVTLVAKGVAKL